MEYALPKSFHQELQKAMQRAPFHPAYARMPPRLRQTLIEEAQAETNSRYNQKIKGIAAISSAFARYFAERKGAAPTYWHCVAALAAIHPIGTPEFKEAVQGLHFLKARLSKMETPLFFGEPEGKTAASTRGQLEETLEQLRTSRQPMTLRKIVKKTGMKMGKAIESVRTLEITPMVDRVEVGGKAAWVFSQSRRKSRLASPRVSPNEIIEKDRRLAFSLAHTFWRENRDILKDKHIDRSELISEALDALANSAHTHYEPAGFSDTTLAQWMIERRLKSFSKKRKFARSLDRPIRSRKQTTFAELVEDKGKGPKKEMIDEVEAALQEVEKILESSPNREARENAGRDMEILRLRFGIDPRGPLRLEAIGKLHGKVTRERIRQIEKKLLNILKKNKALEKLYEEEKEKG